MGAAKDYSWRAGGLPSLQIAILEQTAQVQAQGAVILIFQKLWRRAFLRPNGHGSRIRTDVSGVWFRRPGPLDDAVVRNRVRRAPIKRLLLTRSHKTYFLPLPKPKGFLRQAFRSSFVVSSNAPRSLSRLRIALIVASGLL